MGLGLLSVTSLARLDGTMRQLIGRRSGFAIAPAETCAWTRFISGLEEEPRGHISYQ